MKQSLFAALAPICPVCRRDQGQELPLHLHSVLHADGDEVLQGLIQCPGCMREYPILDGIPVLVPDVRSYIAASILQIHWRDDLPQAMDSLLGDCCGPGSPYELTRYYLGTYAWGHYHDLDPDEPGDAPPLVVQALDRALALAGPLPSGPVLDVGCSVGRSTLHLAARTGQPVLGLDLNFSMLRLARQAARGAVAYPLRRGGLVYQQRRCPVALPGGERVDFWAADATCLPLSTGLFQGAGSLNLLDCVSSPHDHLSELERVVAPGGRAWVGCPYDWSSSATEPPMWLGGHSQRDGAAGSSEALLRALLTPGALPWSLEKLVLLDEQPDVPWQVRLHDRSMMSYALHLVAAARQP